MDIKTVVRNSFRNPLPKDKIYVLCGESGIRGRLLDPPIKRRNICGIEPPFDPLLQEYFFEPNDPWKILVCSVLLNSASRKQVDKVIGDLFYLYPTADALARADITKLSVLFVPITLHNELAITLKQLSADYWCANLKCAAAFIENSLENSINISIEEVKKFRGISPYALDSYRIFVLEEMLNPEEVNDRALSQYCRWQQDTLKLFETKCDLMSREIKIMDQNDQPNTKNQRLVTALDPCIELLITISNAIKNYDADSKLHIDYDNIEALESCSICKKTLSSSGWHVQWHVQLEHNLYSSEYRLTLSSNDGESENHILLSTAHREAAETLMIECESFMKNLAKSTENNHIRSIINDLNRGNL